MGANTYLTERERRILENAKVGIAGAGGLGSNCAMHLVRAGVKKLVIADFDVVSESNLNRQFFFRDQLGRKKVDALAENLRRIEPGLELDISDVRLAPDNIDWTFSGCSVIVEAFDSAEAKSMLLKAVLPLGKPVVAASGLAGWGRSAAIRQRRIGKNLILIGDTESDIHNGLAPVSPRVGIAAAMEANAVVALLIGEEI
ncbi:MAG: sulfur carrier protein ThiS adenylyltransferase ThiF [Kiritimatiellae bacterium]|nr:sulfur carrier protein ThiS adenylyltransferase ThiF [Kiritimatiellia bacterium]MBR0197684.1 sulfur carrier protein ThiS adenylyltransferase ThiF [Kiritimatiellia bacterium]